MQTKQELIAELASAEAIIGEMAQERAALIKVMTAQLEGMTNALQRLHNLANLIRDSWPDGTDPADFWKE